MASVSRCVEVHCLHGSLLICAIQCRYTQNNSFSLLNCYVKITRAGADARAIYSNVLKVCVLLLLQSSILSTLIGQSELLRIF